MYLSDDLLDTIRMILSGVIVILSLVYRIIFVIDVKYTLRRHINALLKNRGIFLVAYQFGLIRQDRRLNIFNVKES